MGVLSRDDVAIPTSWWVLERVKFPILILAQNLDLKQEFQRDWCYLMPFLFILFWLPQFLCLGETGSFVGGGIGEADDVGEGGFGEFATLPSATGV